MMQAFEMWSNGHKCVECLCCIKVEVLGYFQSSGMRYGDAKAATQKGHIYQ